jgi:hypothetical protein
MSNDLIIFTIIDWRLSLYGLLSPLHWYCASTFAEINAGYNADGSLYL